MSAKDNKDYLLEVAHKLGQLTTAVKGQKESINVLFDQIKELRDDIDNFKTDVIPQIKINQSNLRIKMAAVIGGLSIVGSFLTSLFFKILDRWPWHWGK